MSNYPERIVCLTEETTETLYLLGQGDRIVGVSGYTVRPPEARQKPKISAFINAKFDKIEALQPDLVLAFSDLQADLASELVRRGITVVTFNQRTVAEILQMIRMLGGLVGCQREAEQLADRLSADLDRVRDAPCGTIGSTRSNRLTSCNRDRRASRKASAGCTRFSARKFHGDGLGQEPGPRGVAEQTVHGRAAALAVIEREIVHVHAHKAIGFRAIESAAEAHRIADGLAAMLQTERDAVVQQQRQRRDVPRAEVAPDDVAAERKRQPARAIAPPFAEIDDLLQAFIRPGDLSFVDQQSGLDL